MNCSTTWPRPWALPASFTTSSRSMQSSGRVMSGTRKPTSRKPNSCWVTSLCTTSFKGWKYRCPGTRSSCVDLKSLKQRFAGLHSDHRRIALGALRVAFFLLLGKAAGAFKEMAVAYRYGVSDAVDAYQFTMVMANWLPVTIVGALSVVLIPVLVQTKYQSRSSRAHFLGELQGWLIAGGTILAVATYMVWPWVLEWSGAGLSDQVRRMTDDLMFA